MVTGMGSEGGEGKVRKNRSQESILGEEQERNDGVTSLFGGISKRMDVEVNFHHEK